MSNNNPYVTVQGPNYGGGLMNWQGMFNQLGGKPGDAPSGQGPGQAGGAGGVMTPPPGQAGGAGGVMVPPGQPNTTQQQQMQGLGQRLMTMFGLGGQGQALSPPGNPMSLAPPTADGSPQPHAPINPASPRGLF